MIGIRNEQRFGHEFIKPRGDKRYKYICMFSSQHSNDEARCNLQNSFRSQRTTEQAQHRIVNGPPPTAIAQIMIENI